jgi:hypothetical protein
VSGRPLKNWGARWLVREILATREQRLAGHGVERRRLKSQESFPKFASQNSSQELDRLIPCAMIGSL